MKNEPTNEIPGNDNYYWIAECPFDKCNYFSKGKNKNDARTNLTEHILKSHDTKKESSSLGIIFKMVDY